MDRVSAANNLTFSSYLLLDPKHGKESMKVTDCQTSTGQLRLLQANDEPNIRNVNDLIVDVMWERSELLRLPQVMNGIF